MIWNKIAGKIKKMFPNYHDMSEHMGELHYFELYWHYMESFFQEGQSALDIGAQNGRFAIPLLQKGLNVTATDIESSFIKKLSDVSKEHAALKVRNESLDETINKNSEVFDHVLCMELLYTLPNIQESLHGMASLIKPNGQLFCSHRNQGFYLYKYLREHDFDKIESLLQNQNEPFNHQDNEELVQLYESVNLSIDKIVPIGMFSGFGEDPWTDICNPEELNLHKTNQLSKIELNTELIKKYHHNARYSLVIASKK